MSDLAFKRGSTLSLGGIVKLPAGTWTASSKVQLINGIKVTLTVALTALASPGQDGETHTILISKPAADTASWALGTAMMDILFEDAAGNKVPTANFDLIVEGGISG